MPVEPREDDGADEEEEDEEVPIREVAALNAEEEVGAENPPPEPPLWLEPPLPPVTAEEFDATDALASPPDELPPLEPLPPPLLPRLLPLFRPVRFVPSIEAVVTWTSPRFRPERFARSCGVTRETNFSAAVTPVTRSVRTRGPLATGAVRIVDRATT